MMHHLLPLLPWYTLYTLGGGWRPPASFFGGSYVSLPLQEARRTTEISLRLKTRRPDALILLAAGSIDYCLLLLQGGALRVRINLGAGESELSSPPRLRLNDLLWHEVRLSRATADLTLTIDNIHKTSITLPGKFYELNIHYGIFVGGLGDFSEVFLGLLDNYRGCLDKVIYNGIDVLREVRDDPKSTESFDVDWYCSEEFDAPADVPISFVGPKAYMAFRKSYPRAGGTLALGLKTQSPDALLLYNTGPPSKSDFIALEVNKGHLRLLIDKGNGAVELNSTTYISDGMWHEVKADIGPSHLTLEVDGNPEEQQPSIEGENKFFDLSGHLFLGGVEVNKQARALQQGAGNGDKSLAGCMRDISVGDQHRPLTLRDAWMTTSGVKAGCRWSYPCLTKNPCIDGATCIHEGTDGFKCHCEEALCVRQNFTTPYKVFTKTTLPFEMEVLSLTPLEVKEGGRTLISSDHLHLVFDYDKYGVKDSGVRFHVITLPAHGRLDVSDDDTEEEVVAVFSLHDVNQGKVSYTHDGSETRDDSIVLELELNTTVGYVLPSYLKSRHRFVLPVRTELENDIPSVRFPSGDVMQLVSGARVEVTPDVINVTDEDSKPDSIRISILNPKGDSEAYFENSNNPGKAIDAFTKEDLNLGLIFYVHRGGESDSKITIQVSDGISTSESRTLRVEVEELQVNLVSNTGLIMTYSTWSLITHKNLSCSTNSPDPDLEIFFDITKPPEFGVVQKLGSDGGGKWADVSRFSSQQLRKDIIRYLHTSKEPDTDGFKFMLSTQKTNVSSEHTFIITFVPVLVEVVKNEELLMNEVHESLITEENLLSVTKPEVTEKNSIIYTVLSRPVSGTLFLTPGRKTSLKQLDKNSQFTQEDVAKGHVRFKLLKKRYTVFRDSFQFRVSSKGYSSDVRAFTIHHSPPSLNKSIVTEPLNVHEGSKELVTQKNLHVKIEGIKDVIFNITSGPKHGTINIADGSGFFPGKSDAHSFTSRDIQSSLVYYQHDDSESREDNFSFVASAEDADIDFRYEGVMRIKINLVNDNRPVRAIEKLLNVVMNKERVITPNDLLFTDADINTQPSEIRYVLREMQNGHFLRTDDPSAAAAAEFTQEDVDAGRILFRHKGPSYGRASLTVTDGHFSTSGLLEIVASEAYVEIVNNTGIIVPRGKEAFISHLNLSVETNMDSRTSTALFYVVKPPRFGNLLLHGQVGSKFSQEDLHKRELKYANKGNPSFKDEFYFQARIGKVTAEGIFDIKVYPESYWDPLVVTNNNTVKVEEGSSVTLGQSALKVTHPGITPTGIRYVVVQRPQHGYLEVKVGQAFGGGEYEDEAGLFKPEVSTFTQASVNEGRVRYVETGVNVTTDHFVFDVTNGISSLSRLIYTIQVIPKTISLLAGELVIEEGSQTIVTTDVVRVETHYYSDKITQYLVDDDPQAGILQLSSALGRRIQAFTPLQLQQGLVLYVHDGSETQTDSFSVVAASGKRKSSPAVIKVTVEAVNDEAPVVVNNTGLRLWEGKTLPITASNLGVFDPDTDPEDIIIRVSTPNTGYIAMSSNLSYPVSTFTQADVNNNRIYFVHTGWLSGVFRWEASDQVQATESNVFSVTARPITLIQLHNKPLHVFPLMQQPITPKTLLAVTSDYDSTRTISYVIQKLPMLGHLLFREAGGSLVRVNNFTQKHINDSRVFFKHVRPFADLSSMDSFVFDVDTNFADSLKGSIFHIEISVASLGGVGLEKYLGLAPLDVREGGIVIVGTNNIDLPAVSKFIRKYPRVLEISRFAPKLQSTVTSVPKHGVINVQGHNITEGYIFSSRDIENNHMYYLHDDSDTVNDSMGFKVALTTNSSSGDVLLFNGSLPINITAVNDQPFTLLTPSPVLFVVHHQTTVISNHNLLTTDPDTNASEIIYELMSAPSHGRLIFADNYSLAVQSFSQQDVDDGRLLYSHDGTNSSARFYFKVSDGRHTPKYTVFTIEVQPLTLELVNHTTIPLQQASTITYLTPKYLSAVTNGNPNHIFYNVTRAPKFGHLYMDDRPIQRFSQISVIKNEVFYVQKDLSESSDSFSVDLWTWEAALLGVEVNIVVMPLISSKPLISVVGDRTRISLQNLDATQLATSTGSNPIYKVKRRPRFGKIKKINLHTKRSGHSFEVHDFTHEEVRAGLIYFVARKLNLKTEKLLHDALHYVLQVPSPGVQPAEGTLPISLVEDVEAGAVLTGAEISRHLRPDLSPTNIHDGLDDAAAGSEYLGGISGIPLHFVVMVTVAVGAFVIVVALIVIVRWATRHNPQAQGQGESRDRAVGGVIATAHPSLSSHFKADAYMGNDLMELKCRPNDLVMSPERHLHPNGSTVGPVPTLQLTELDATWKTDLVSDAPLVVPQLKVTPISNDTTVKPAPPPPDVSLAGYPYGEETRPAADSSSSSCSGGHHREIKEDEEEKEEEEESSEEASTILRRNQYWV